MSENRAPLSVVETGFTDKQKELLRDAHSLAREEDAGDIVGYAIVALYEEGYNTRVVTPDSQDKHFFSLYCKELIDEGIIENEEALAMREAE